MGSLGGHPVGWRISETQRMSPGTMASLACSCCWSPGLTRTERPGHLGMKAWVLVPAPASAVSQASPIPCWACFLISNKMGHATGDDPGVSDSGLRISSPFLVLWEFPRWTLTTEDALATDRRTASCPAHSCLRSSRLSCRSCARSSVSTIPGVWPGFPPRISLTPGRSALTAGFQAQLGYLKPRQHDTRTLPSILSIVPASLSFYKWKNESPEKLCNLPQVTQPVSGKDRI